MSRNYELIPKADAAIGPRLEDQEAVRRLPSSVHETKRPTVEQPNDLDVDLHGVLQAILRRRGWIYAWVAIMLAVAALVCLFMTPQYKAESKLQILKQDTSGLSLGAGNTSLDAGPDPLDFNMTLQTQLGVLKSDTLAWQVMRELNLVDAKNAGPDVDAKDAGVNDAATNKDADPNPPLADNAEISPPTKFGDPAPDKQAARALKEFKSNLKVNAISGTRLIAVSFTHPDPKMAAKIVNQLVSDFVEYNFRVRYEATEKATTWLRRQLVDLKSQVEKSQERVVQLQRESGIFGEDEHHNIVLTRLEQLNNELTSAEADRVIKENVYKLSRSGNPELVAGMIGAQPERNVPEGANAAALLNKLREQEATLDAEYAQASAKYGPAYPRLIQIKEKLESVRSSIAAELGKMSERAKNEYQLSASREAAARKAFTDQKAVAAEMNDKATNFLIAKREAESSRVLYEHLLEKLNEAGVLAGLHSSALHVLDPARVPTLPARPNVPLYLGLGALAGLFLGLVSVFVVEAMDRSVRDVGRIESTTYVPVLGVIPDARLVPKTGLKNLKAGMREAPKGASRPALVSSLNNAVVSEAFRAVRTSLLLSPAETPSKVLVVTSGMPQEGKSFVSLNLAAAFAHNGCKVLLVDADLRCATLSNVLKARTGIGLSDVLRKLRQSGPGLTANQILCGDLDASSPYRQIDEVPGLTFMPAGVCPHDPSEMLGSQQMSALVEYWRKHFDYVLIDTPPALPVTDAVVLSRQVDAVIVAVRFAVTTQPSIIRTIRLFRDVQAARIGVLVNAMDVRSPEYYQYSGFYGTEAYNRDSDNSPLLSPAPPQPNQKGGNV
jgi:capsular exopolysaccharide synthesis family protein